MLSVKRLKTFFKHFEKIYRAKTYAKFVAADTGRNACMVFFDMYRCYANSGIDSEQYCFYRLAFKSADQKKEYLSKQSMKSMQLKLNRGSLKLAQNKLIFYQHCLRSQIPTPDIFGFIPSADIPVPENIPIIATARKLGEFLAMSPHKKMIFKPVDGAFGKSVCLVEKRANGLAVNLEKTWSVDALFKYCREKAVNLAGQKSAGFIIQDYLEPDRRLRNIMPGPGLGTIRIHTVVDRNNAIKMFLPCAKLPAQGQIIDNFQAGRSNNILASVDINNGKLIHAWSFDNQNMRLLDLERHITTRVSFRNLVIPCWQELLDISKRAAAAFSELKTVGWDIAISSKGISVIEGNPLYGCVAIQVAYNKGIKTLIEEYFG